MAAFANGYALDADDIDYFGKALAADHASWRHSPLIVEQAGLAPTVVMTASLDPLRDEGRAYAAKLAQAGVEVSFVEGKGLIHGFCTYRKAIPSGQADLVAACEAARLLLMRGVQGAP
jgi:acetyl esterase